LPSSGNFPINNPIAPGLGNRSDGVVPTLLARKLLIMLPHLFILGHSRSWGSHKT